MGAIFGVLGTVSDAELWAMGRALAHRGKAVHLRRCADDLAVGAIGADPALSVFAEDGLVTVCDTTVYNRAAALSLVQRTDGATASDSPAAVLHALYHSKGPEALESVEGDYAFVLVERQQERITLGRDHLGVRPLHYTVLPSGGVAFASEYKALLQLSEVRPEVDRDMVQHLQCAKCLPAGRTLLANVVEVPPGGMVWLDCAGVVLSRTRFAPPIVEVTATDEAEASELVLRTLKEAVQRRAQDVNRIGLAMSGGIDSIGMAFLLRELYPKRPIHTFTAGHDRSNRELVTARQVAAAIGSVHHEVMTGPELLNSKHLYALAWHLEDPIARSEALQLYEIAGTARDYVGVLLHGDGADGLFAGMPRHRVLWLMAKLPPQLRGPLDDFYNLTQLGMPPRGSLGKALDRAYNRGRVPPVPRVLGGRMPERMALPPAGPEFVNISCARAYPLGRRGQKFDRAFGAWGLEARSPFYDREFTRVAFSITDRLKLRGRTNKYILRKALAKVVPEDFLRVPKFPQRMTYDLAFAEALDAVGRAALSEEAVRRRGLFEPEGIRRLFRSRADRPYAPEAAMRLWTAVLTEFWAQQFVDRRGVPQRLPNTIEVDAPGGATGSRPRDKALEAG